jgi:hypothetical protein
MKSSTRGVVLVGAIAVAALTVASVFVFRSVERPGEDPGSAAAPAPDDATPSPEAPGQVGIQGSDAMRGVRDASVLQAAPLPAEGPPPPASRSDGGAPAAVVEEPTPRAPQGGAVYDRAVLDARRIERPVPAVNPLRREVMKAGPRRGAQGGGPITAPSPLLPAPGPSRPCAIATTGDSPVAAACQEGGRQYAKKTMKKMVSTARNRGARFTCESCHVDVDTYTLLESARSEFARLLEVTK